MISSPKPTSVFRLIVLGCVLVALACGAGPELEAQNEPVTAESIELSTRGSDPAQPDDSSTPTDSTPADSVPAGSVPAESAPDQSEPNAPEASDAEEFVQVVPIRFESNVDDVSAAELEQVSLAILNDERGWVKAGFEFVADPESVYRVVLAEGPEVDRLCLPLSTGGTVSCQNGPVVALNADRWRTAVSHWDSTVEDYRGYLVNHEVGHLIGQRHPQPRCPVAGRPAGVMEQQTGSLNGCVGNAWPRDWEIELASIRPVVYAPLPSWAPDPVPSNAEGS